MKKQMELIAFYLPKALTRNEVEEALDITLNKGIEATYYAEMDKGLLAYTQFNVLTMINTPRDKIIDTLESLGIEEAENFDQSGLCQDYPIRIDSELPTSFAVDNDRITLKGHLYKP